ncbi:MAG: NAD-dependent epimerase/dehydratase family protein [Bdellovibrionota bacterium]
MAKKTLVTGAAGFIGSHVVRELLARNREVKAFLLPNENAKNIEGLDVEIVRGDVTDPASVRQAMEGVDRLFHLAAIYALWLPKREKMYEVNCIGSLNVLWAAFKKNLDRVVYTSSIAAVGFRGDGSPSDESVACNQMGKANDYVYSKWLSEEEAKTFAREGLPLVFCNPAGPIGARDIGPTPTGQMLVEIAKGILRFYFDTGVNLVDVEDVARGHVLAEEKGRVGERYLLSNQNFTMPELFDLFSRVTGMSVKPRRVPLSLVVPLGDLLEYRADHVTRERPLLTGGSLRYAKNPLYYDNSKARKELGFDPKPLEPAVRRAIDWFIENGYIKSKKFIERYRREAA